MAAATPQGPENRLRLRRSISPILKPLIRAYVLGYASAVAPRLITLVLQHVTKYRKPRAVGQPHESFVASLQRIIRGGLELQRFPTFCAALIGGTTLLEFILLSSVTRLNKRLNREAVRRLSTWISAFVAAWLSLRLLQSKKTGSFSETVQTYPDSSPAAKRENVRYAGRTLDLTLFASTRAVDVIVGELWARRRKRRLAAGQWSWVESFISGMTDPSIFAASCALIMWAWFYNPSTLPRAYTKWISSAAAVDSRLIEALRRFRSREIRYGEDTGQASLLQPMCKDYQWPLSWGDPERSIPLPCEVVHMGCGPSCEYHALSRFYRSFKWSMATYLPLNLVASAGKIRNTRRHHLGAALLSAVRSSTFLASFVTFFYYGVCLARTRLGPLILGRHADARQTIDSGVCVGAGCLLCGWSILVENAARRKDMALFVAPRALATLLPRRYDRGKQWRETLVFAASTAVVLTCVRENRRRVRGVLGNVLAGVLEA